MPERIEITTDRGESRVFPIEGPKVWLGSGEEAEIRLRRRSLTPRHLCFVQTDHGYRVEPSHPGGTVEVNGESLFCKDLEAGDRIALPGLELRWLCDEPGPRQVAIERAVVEPPSTPRIRGGASRRGRVARRRRPANWLPVSALIATVLLVIVLVLRTLSGSTWPHSPQHYVDLARAQLDNGQPQRALDTIAFALREATGTAREQALALEAEIHRRQVERAEAPKIASARHQHDLLEGFAARYLGEAVARPAAREFVRLCDEWLVAHADVCERSDEAKPMLREVNELRARYAAIAVLSEPDTEQDVLFAARSRLGFLFRDYRGAFRRIDTFLAAHPEAAELQKERAVMLSDGAQWLQGRVHSIEALLDRGDTGNAKNDLDQLEKWSIVPEWQSVIPPLRARLERDR